MTAPLPPPAGTASPRGLLLSCACGARPRAGFDLLGKRVRCPGCKASLQVPARADAGESPPPGTPPPGTRCSICLAAVEDAAGAVLCPSCRLAYHGECWRETGGCGTFGCPLAPEAPKEEPGDGPVQTAWGDSKKCPGCGKEIQAIAIKCRHCKADLGTRDALSTREWKEIQRKKKADGKGRPLAVTAFLCSATFVGAPVGVGIALYHLRDRERRESLESADRILHFGALGVPAVYLLLLIVMKAAGW